MVRTSRHRETVAVLSQKLSKMVLKPRTISVRSKVISSIATTLNLEFNSVCRKMKHSLFHCSILTSPGPTTTNLDVLQDKCIDDCWNVNGNQSLSDSWTQFTRFTFLKRKLRMDIHDPRGDSRKEVIKEAQKMKKKVHFATLMDIGHI